jgi:hypothetical protein
MKTFDWKYSNVKILSPFSYNRKSCLSLIQVGILEIWGWNEYCIEIPTGNGHNM